MTGDILLKADRMSMSNSLELRVPFLDREVFEVASRINPKWSLKGNTTKRVLRKAARGIIPDFVLDRPKLGFPVPMGDWLRGDLKD
ncbi:MAG: asparagine synthase C-terminal domain-containing protein [Clostridia bacterium]|nr:asparagine synthase C-terminal domain-containing protein [Clostridia bacterium]